MAAAVQNIRRLQAAILRQGAQLGEQQLGVDMLVRVEQLRVVLDTVGDLANIAGDAAFMFLDIDLGDIDGAAQRRLAPGRRTSRPGPD